MKRRGFTLIEMMVAVSLFATLGLIMTDLFLIFNRAQRRTQAAAAVQSDARVMLAQITDLIRSGQIDYSQYNPSVTNPTTQLFLIDSQGRNVLIRKSDTVFANTKCPNAASTPCLEISVNGGPFSAMTSKRLKVIGTAFYIDPPQSPTVQSGGVYTYNRQPRVTLTIGMQGVSLQVPEQATTFVQTTITSRFLLR